MKKILFVFHSENIQSGATRSLMDIVDYLIDCGEFCIQAVFPASEGSAIEHLREKNIKTYSYKYGGLMQNLSQPWLKRVAKYPLLFYRYAKVHFEAGKAAKELEKENFDLVYSNTSSIIFGGLLGKRLGCKQIWHIREFRKKDHRIEFFLGDKCLKRFINKNADAVLYVSKSVMNDHLDCIPEEKSYVTYNSYPKSFIRPRENFNYTEKLNVMIAGDIKPSKGQFDVVKAVEAANNKLGGQFITAHLAGRISNVPYSDEMNKYISEHSLENCVVRYGQVSDMISLRDKMDVGIVASTNEAFGRTTIEGMLSMMAMIGRNSGGTTEQIKHMETGLLYDGSVEDLTKQILEFYNNRNKMEEIARKGFEECVVLHTRGRCANTAKTAILKVLS